MAEIYTPEVVEESVMVGYPIDINPDNQSLVSIRHGGETPDSRSVVLADFMVMCSCNGTKERVEECLGRRALGKEPMGSSLTNQTFINDETAIELKRRCAELGEKRLPKDGK